LEHGVVLTLLIESIQNQIESYKKLYPHESLDQLESQLVDELTDPEFPIMLRSNMRGHITCSAFVVNPTKSHALMIDHTFLKRWLPPGGHYEGDESLQSSAAREVLEETGLTCTIPLGSIPINIDSHSIPENTKKSESAHVHHDFMYLAIADNDSEITLQLEEVNSAKWVPISDLLALNDRVGVVARRISTN
jgi:8-oxo-dGTP pyrophosphatase MutT (NUDIX family)